MSSSELKKLIKTLAYARRGTTGQRYITGLKNNKRNQIFFNIHVDVPRLENNSRNHLFWRYFVDVIRGRTKIIARK